MWVVVHSVTAMLIDCDTCTGRGAACTDCVVTWLTAVQRPDGPRLTLTATETHTIKVLADARLVPPLRHAPPDRGRRQTPGAARRTG